MSTDRSRLVSSIRRIVLTDPDLSSALDEWKNRGDQASSTGTGASDAERDRLCCDGSTSDNPNPGADTRDTSEGGQDGINADDPALLDSGPGSLTGVTDCATGEPICFEGADGIPPEGWEDNKTIAPNEFDDGSFKSIAVAGGVTVCTQVYFSTYGILFQFIIQCYAENSPGEEVIDYDENNIYTDSRTLTVVRSETEEPQDDEIFIKHPEDGCTNLAIKNGSIVGSKYDPENDGSYSKPMSEIELCDGSGNSFFLSPAANGGWKTIDATKTDGYLYDSQGNKIAHIDGNEYADPDV